jgi:hypothetical protein
MEPIEKFYEKLKQFDWFYEMIDDFKKWRKLNTLYRQLKYEASTTSLKQKLFDAFEKYRDDTIDGKNINNIPQLEDILKEKEKKEEEIANE